MFLQYFDTVGWVLTCKNPRPYNLYCVGGDLNHAQSIIQYMVVTMTACKRLLLLNELLTRCGDVCLDFLMLFQI